MTVYDLTHTLNTALSLYPGTAAPQFKRVISENFKMTELSIQSHMGTHMDAPYHCIQAGTTLDALDASQFVGEAYLLNVSQCGAEISLELLKRHEEAIAAVDFLILDTGWGRSYGSEAYLKGFPVLSRAAATWLSNQALKGIGIDAISVDPIESRDFVNHHLLLSKGKLIIENLAGLTELPVNRFTLVAAPLKYENADGAPARVLAFLP